MVFAAAEAEIVLAVLCLEDVEAVGESLVKFGVVVVDDVLGERRKGL